MDLYVRTVRRLVIDGKGFDDTGPAGLVKPRCPNLVVGAVQSYCIIGVSRPGQILIRPDDRENFWIGIWDGVDDSI